MTVETRVLIVNADDFGQDLGINGGIIESHELGIVVSEGIQLRTFHICELERSNATAA